jgi:5'-nucleotidase
MIRTPTILLAAFLAASCSAPPPLQLSVVGTNDVHGQLVENGKRGGFVTLSAYVNAIRDARNAEGGATLLIDAGDMWQGTLESNLSEGAAMVDAYNALQYTAATIGNHEFDFGPAGPAATPSEPGHDPRGALKQRAMEADFPILAANLVDQRTGELVKWDNVQPSILVDVDAIKVGIIGVMTARALQRTIALNVGDLEVAPLAPAIINEATALRAAGANLVIVTAHAGSECTEFDDPDDLSSCQRDGEIFEVARNLPAGLVDHIIAGHVHQGVAHVVNGIAITSAYSSTRAFSRVDYSIDRRSGQVLERTVYPPQLLIPGAVYEGQTIEPDVSVAAIADEAVRLASDMRASKVGVRLTTPFTLWGNPESSLGNLFTEALFATVSADVVIHNVAGGLRTGLPAGDLQFGDVYELSPFENRVVLIELSGAQLRKVVAEQAHRGIRSMGFSGMKVFVQCNDKKKTVDIYLSDGDVVSDDDDITIAVNDYIATGGDNILTNVMPAGGFPIDESQPLTRDLFIAYLTDRGGDIAASEFDTSADPKWNLPDDLDSECKLEL